MLHSSEIPEDRDQIGGDACQEHGGYGAVVRKMYSISNGERAIGLMGWGSRGTVAG